ncbi:DUF523 and DUF1722 domain-containing protein [Methanolobus sp.]|uniref:YbgA family protein n=1 Tax=Methanolobus sp. TaxID=1874737 RepID=UPI0025CC76BC|nr:DUF523 and DUF1722 domain-containing protein [Methanolobus sp.]
MRQFPRPIVLVSRCLEFDSVRYNGQLVRSQIVRDMIPYVDFIKVCPEVDIGMGVPRNPLRIIKKDGKYRLIQQKTGEDFTEKMNTFSVKFLGDLGDIDGFIFKGLSPSVGLDDVKVYSKMSMSPVIERTAGLFAKYVIAKYPGNPMEENERLRNLHIRHHFLTQLYTFTTFRQVKAEKSLRALTRFHKNNRFLLMSYDDELLKEMSELVGSGSEINELFINYEGLLKRVVRKPGSLDLKLAVVRNMFSMFEDVGQDENSFFEYTLKRYIDNRISWDAAIEMLRLFAFCSFGENAYEDTFLYPYPEELKALVDVDREKDYWDK